MLRLNEVLQINWQSWIKNLVFHTTLGFTKIVYTVGNYKNDKLVNFCGNEKFHLKCECIVGSTINETKKPILYSVLLDETPRHENNFPWTELYKLLYRWILNEIFCTKKIMRRRK